MKTIYLAGSLRNPRVIEVGNAIRALGYDVFDDWHAVGPEADDYWQKYETAKGLTYKQALAGWAARHVYEFDLHHLNRAHSFVLLLPAGKSSHMELGYMIGQGKPGFVLFDNGEPERWDVMYQFATAICFSLNELLQEVTHV